MTAHWYCRIAGEERGPFTAAQLRGMAADGSLSTGDPVRQGKFGVWVPAASVKGLFDPTSPSQHAASPSQRAGSPPQHAAEVKPAAPDPPPPPKPRPLLRAEPIAGSAEGPEPPPSLPHDVGIDLSAEPVRPPPPPITAKRGWRSTGLDFLADQAEMPPQAAARPPAGTGRHSGEPALAIRRWLLPSLLGVLAILVVVLLAISSVERFRAAGSSEADSTSGKAKPTEGERQPDKGGQPGAKRPPAVAKGVPGPPGAAPTASWIDASREPWKCGDVTVKVPSVTIATATLLDAAKRVSDTQDEFLLIRVELTNQSSTRKIEYSSWGVRGQEPQLVDDLKNKYALQKAPGGGIFEGQVRSKSIYPEKSLEDLLVFERPVGRAKFLRLQLPATAFEGQGTGSIEIPMSMVKSGQGPAGKSPAEPATARSKGPPPKPETKAAVPSKGPPRGFAGAAAMGERAPPPKPATPETDFGIKPEEAPAEAAPPPKRGPPPQPPIKGSSPEAKRS